MTLSRVCSPISPQALIVETISCRSNVPSLSKLIRIGNPPPRHIIPNILFKPAKLQTRFFASPIIRFSKIKLFG